MPFSARQGFFASTSELPDWYEITGTQWLATASQFNSAGGGLASYVTVNEFNGGSQRYRSSVLHPNGNIYLPPRSSNDGMLEFDPATENSSYITTGAIPTGPTSSGRKFQGGVLTESGNIVMIPFDYTKVVQYDPVADTATEFGSISGSAKFTGGVLGENGNIYCVPQNHNGVLEIDPVNEVTTVKTYGISMTSATKWWGGCRSAKTDKIYMAPIRDSRGFLVISADGQSATTETYGYSYSTSISEHYGCSTDMYGNIVAIVGDNTSSGSTKVIDPVANTSFTVAITGTTYGGITAGDGNVYTIPKDTNGVRKIDLSGGNATPTVTTVGSAEHGPRMAATTALDGKTYFFPDTSDTTVFKLDKNIDTSLGNYANVLISPYLQTGKN